MPQSPQSALKTAANRLAKEARHLHKAAQATELVATPVTPDVDAFIAEMASLGTKKQAEVAQQAAERTSEAQRVIAPLVARARQLLAGGEAVKEHAALIGKLVALPRDTIRKTVRVRVTPGSSETTLTRLAFLRRTVTEVQELLGADDRDVEKCLGAVERLTTVADQNGKLAIAHLQYALSLSDRPAAIRTRMVQVTKLLSQLAEDFNSGEGTVQGEPQQTPVVCETASVPPILWLSGQAGDLVKEETK